MTPRGRDSGEVEREPQADYVGRRYFRQRNRAVRAVAHNFVDGGIFVLCTSLEWKPSLGGRGKAPQASAYFSILPIEWSATPLEQAAQEGFNVPAVEVCS